MDDDTLIAEAVCAAYMVAEERAGNPSKWTHETGCRFRDDVVRLFRKWIADCGKRVVFEDA